MSLVLSKLNVKELGQWNIKMYLECDVRDNDRNDLLKRTPIQLKSTTNTYIRWRKSNKSKWLLDH